ncbi:MAG: hypothetical protein K0R39_3717 [Symbiobacteriaceae bacterium]|jgi:hypothetical protein|nr:hypothetical protein [Symbiobacteriaceae bacterium]
MSWSNNHDCGCNHKRDDDSFKKHDDDCGCRDRHHDDRFDCGCKSHSRSVIIQCKCGDCFEIKRSHCGPCSRLFKHSW